MATASSRPRTPSNTQPPPEGLPAITENSSNQSKDQRRTSSLGFLRRAKSTEPLSGKSKKMSKAQALEEERRRREAMPKHAPRLPDLSPTPILETFGGDERHDTVGTLVSEPNPSQHLAPRSSVSTPVNNDYDPYARTESMTHRGRYSYASSAVSTVNNPRRLRRRKDPTPYNILVVGARNSGKTSFLNFLRKSLEMPAHKHPTRAPGEEEYYDRHAPANEGFVYHYLETEIDGERVGLTLWDSEGFERDLVDIQLSGVTAFLENKFEETLKEEMKVIRSPGARDTHIHCTFLILDPVRLDANIAAAERASRGTPKASDKPVTGILDQSLDLQILRKMLGKTTIVPVISKADTITEAHMTYLRKAVWASLKEANIDPLEVLSLDEQEEYTSSESADEEEDEETEDQEGHAKGETTDNADDKESKPAPTPGSPSSRSASSRKSSASQAAAQRLPFSTLSPDSYSLNAGDGPVGRKFPWGFADPYNPEHCDFLRLRDSVFSDWRSELREASRVIWYERWRTSRLNPHLPAPAPQKRQYSGRMGPSNYAY
ncbi:septin [Aspergillus campestris IBT 28561]|uniref:Septin n=1 Tax=Aspergillus campestris (strain IBT 28561) TaxID=1392248 RepID=A0A2I1DDA3_ASPC2|nr:septin [Aspergillus campestris IBT 28561]PKY07846.1 septin [Aspergillus campestris IBT 28561]